MILPHHLPVECDRRLECGESARHRRGPVDRPVMKEAVAAVQYPAVADVDRDASVATGVPRQPDQRDARRHLIELLGRRESPPLLAVRSVLDDLGSMRPWGRAEAELLSTRRGPHRAARLHRGDVYLGFGEIGDAADVVAVEMCDDDVAHVVTAKAKPLNLIGPTRRAGSSQSFDPNLTCAVLHGSSRLDVR